MNNIQQGKLAMPKRTLLQRVLRSSMSSVLSTMLKRVEKHSQQRHRNKLHLETLEPRVLMSGDVNPAELSIPGSIDIPGEKDVYAFTVEETTRIVFDSQTNTSALSWRLDGPAGLISNTNFSSTDPVLELVAGNYQVSVSGSGDTTGAYNLRLIDAATAADLIPGEEVSGTLDGGNKTAVYRFAAQTGDRLFFDGISEPSGSVSWRLIDPFGRQELSAYGVSSDVDTFAVQRTGTYLLLVDGSNGNDAPVNYRFNLRPVQDSLASLELDSVVVADIDQPGKTANFTFSLVTATEVLFDDLSNDGKFLWALTGPDGQTVSRRQVTSSSDFNARQWLHLGPGNYTLSLDANMATTGQTAFRLLSSASSQPLVVGAAMSGSLDQARGSAIYRVSLQAGDKLYLEGHAVTHGLIGWRLIDPYGDLAASRSSLLTGGVCNVEMTGEYWLVLDGAGGNAPADSVTYEFTLRAVPDLAADLAVGASVAGSIAIAGQTTAYAFTLTQPTRLVFDSLSNRSDMLWSLHGPRGTEILDRRFDLSDAASGVSFLTLPAGEYRLTVRGSGNATGAYAFHLFDVAVATDVMLGTSVTATLTPGNTTHLYRLTVAAGDRLAFDGLSLTDGSASWHLFDPYGREIYVREMDDFSNLTTDMPLLGSYILLVEGDVTNTAPVDYAFQFNFVDNSAQPDLPAGTAMILGEVIADNLSSTGATQVYRFTLAQDSFVVFDTQTTTSNLTWSLSGPRGQEVDGVQLYASDANQRNPIYSLAAGDYALTVKAQYGTGAYAFRLFDPSAFATLNLGEQITLSRSPANSTLGYRFDAEAGEVFNIRSQSGDGYWRVIDAYGKQVYERYAANLMTFTTPTSGTYTLINEGDYSQSGNTSVSFRMDKEIKQTRALVMNDTLTGNLAGGYEYHRYTFTLAAPTTLVLDVLENPGAKASNIGWSLTGSGSTNLSVSTNNPLTLGPGEYTLTVSSTDYLAHGYAFRMLTRDAASVLNLDTLTQGIMTPDASTLLYRFDGSQGQRLYFDGQDASSSNAYSTWYLTDAYGKPVAYEFTYYDTAITLPTSGEYLLSVRHDFRSDSAGQRNTTFKLFLQRETLSTLALETDVTGSLSQPYEKVKYAFTLAGPTTVLVDTWGTSNNVYWSLAGPRGSEVSSRQFTDYSNNVYALPAGNYEFTVIAGNLYTGIFNFRIADLAQTADLALDTSIPVSLVPGDRSHAWRFSLDDSAELLFDMMTTGVTGDWRIYDSSGRARTSGNLSNDSSRFSLSAGEYLLALNGSNATVTEFDMALRIATTRSELLVLDSLLTGNLLPAQRTEYRFQVDAPTTLLFDSLTNNSNLRWDLIAPSGSTLRSGYTFTGSEYGDSSALISLATSGEYLLRVYSVSNVETEFDLLLHSLNHAEAMTLGEIQSVTLAPGNSTRILAFDGLAGTYFSFQSETLSAGSAQVWLINPNGVQETSPSKAAQGFSRALATSGRYYLVLQGALANSEPVTLNFSTQLVQNRTLALSLESEARSSIDAQGQTDTWQFHLDSATTVLFDGLEGGNIGGNIVWSLLDQAGNKVNSGLMTDLKLLRLDVGDYRLQVRGNGNYGSVPGAYGLRLMDISGVPELALGSIDATQSISHAAGVYRLQTHAGERYYLHALEKGGQVGRLQVFNAQGQLQTSAALPNAGFEFLSGTLGGNYYVVVDGDGADAPVDYSLSLYKVEETRFDTSPDATLEGDLTAPNQYHVYHFTLPAYTRFLLADAGSDVGVRWQLLSQGDSSTAWSTFPANPSGNAMQYRYASENTIVVSNSEAAGGHYRIRLLDPAAATELPTQGVSASLTHGRDALAYGFDLETRGRLRVDLTTGDPAKLAWALYRDYTIMSSGQGIPLDTPELSSGHYTLVVYGNAAADESVDFSLNLAPAPILPLTLGETITQVFPNAGSVVDYAFTLDAAGQVLFDARNAGSNAHFKFLDIHGDNVYDGYTNSGANPSTRLVNLQAGSYVLRLTRSTAGTPADFSFRLATPAQLDAGVITLGTPVNGSLSAGLGAAMYRFSVQAGDRIDISPMAGGGTLYWRLIDPTGNTLISATSSAYSNYLIRKSGEYTVLLEGALNASTALEYSFGVSLRSHEDLLPAGTALTLGEPVSGQLAPSTSKTYRFSLAEAGMVVISGRSDDGRTLQVKLVTSETTYYPNSLGAQATYTSEYTLQAGDYAITVSETGNGMATTAGFQLWVESSASAQLVNVGDDWVADGHRLYKFSLEEGQMVAFRSPGNASWYIYNPNLSSQQWVGRGDSYYQRFTASQAGDYFAMLDSDYSDEPGFAVLETRNVGERLLPLTLGETQTGLLDRVTDDFYTFTLDAPTSLLLDVISGGDRYVDWQLSRDGLDLESGYWYSGYADTYANRLLNLAAGTYRLALDGYGTAFSFRLLDLATASDLVAGETQSGSLDSGQASIYRFDAQTGDSLIYQPLDVTNFSGYWRLIRPDGETISSGNSISINDVVSNLDVSGTYSLIWDTNQNGEDYWWYGGGPGHPVINAPYSFRFSLLPQAAPLDLVLGTAITGTPAADGQLGYQFSTNAGTALWLDDLANAGNTTWNVTGENGEYIASGYLDGMNLIRLPAAGVYRLIFSTEVGGDPVSIQFRLRDLLTNAIEIDSGVANTATISPGEIHAYRVDVQSGESLIYAPAEQGNLRGWWKLLGPDGVRIGGNNALDQRQVLRELALAGTYHLLWFAEPGYGEPETDYGFSVTTLAVGAPLSLLLDTDTAGVMATDGRLHYQFTGLADSMLWLDDLGSADHPAWELYDPDGNRASQGTLGNADASLMHLTETGIYNLVFLLDEQIAPGLEGIRFKLQDLLANALSVNPDGNLTGSLIPGESEVFALTAQAGDAVVYRATDIGGLTGTWRLLNSQGEVLSSGNNLGVDRVIKALPANATYYLLWDTDSGTEGDGTDQPLPYVLNLSLASHSTPLPLELGEIQSHALGADGVLAYRFQLDVSRTLWLDILNRVAGMNWRILDADGKVRANGAYATGAPFSLDWGTYTLEFRPQADQPVQADIRFRLRDAAANAMSLATDVQHDASLEAGAGAHIYRFYASTSEKFKFLSHAAGASPLTWRLYSPFGALVANGKVDANSGLINLSAQTNGLFYLVIDGAQGLASAADYAFTASLGKLLNSLITGNASSAVTQRYTFHLDEPTWLAFDASKATLESNDNYAYWHLDGPAGWIFSERMYSTYIYSWLQDPMRLLAAGDYVLSVSGTHATYSLDYQFRVMDLSSAVELTLGTQVSGTLSPGNSTQLFRFDAQANEQYNFTGLQDITGYWRLFDPSGKELFDNSQSTDKRGIRATASGTYLLAIEGGNHIGSAQNFNFSVWTPEDVDGFAFNTPLEDSLGAGAQHRYRFQLDTPTWLDFDSLSVSGNSRLSWRLDGPGGNVFSQNANYYWHDFGKYLLPGEYQLTFDNTGTTAASYAFRVLDAGSATPISVGTPITAQITPANGTRLFSFDANAGERYFFDARSGSGGYWSLIDPLGQVVFDVSLNTDVGPQTLAVSGTYLLVVEGNNSNSGAAINFDFTVHQVPDTPVVTLDTLVVQPAPDLAVNQVTLTPDTGLHTGERVRITWTLENRGELAASGAWNDRVILRNLDNGRLLLNVVVPYDANDPQQGAILPGEALTRSVWIDLPEDALAAGQVEVSVIADADNLLRESNASATGEGNNARSLQVLIEPSPYADLVVENFGLSPDGDFSPGDTVTLTWLTANRGDKAVSRSWSERVEIRNLSNNQVLATATIADDHAINGDLAVAAQRARSVQFIWPDGASAAGQFAFRILLDSTQAIAEANPTDTGESNNSVERIRIVGPDLRVKNLSLAQTTLEAGGLVTVNWEDWNEGSVATAIGFNDRIVVVNKSTGAQLLDTSIAYDHTQNGPILAGDKRARSFTFRLPDGAQGAGNIEITITADQNSGGLGVLFETNLGGNAETNNSAKTQALSATRPYADLAMLTLGAPASGVSGSEVELNWTVKNIGLVSTGATNWGDRVVLSKNTIIGDSDDVILANIAHTGPLDVGASYTQTTSVRLPSRIQGNYYLSVVADALTNVLEPDTRGNNGKLSGAISIATANADLVPEFSLIPVEATANRSARVEWNVRNQGSIPTDVSLWVDQVYLSATQSLDSSAILLGSVTHVGALEAGGSYLGGLDFVLPRTLSGAMYFIVKTDAFANTYELGNTANNTTATAQTTLVHPLPKANLQVEGLQTSGIWNVGEAQSISYTVRNSGNETASTWLVEQIRLVDTNNSGNVIDLGTPQQSRTLAPSASYSQTFNFTVPALASGDWRLEVLADAYQHVDEQNESDNVSSAVVSIVHPDVSVSSVTLDGTLQGGEAIQLHWTTRNVGTSATATFIDRVYLSRDGQFDTADFKLGEFSHASIGAGADAAATLSVLLPVDATGAYQLLVITDATAQLNETPTGEANNLDATSIDVAQDGYADLAVTGVQAPTQLIDDPATLNVEWSVTNLGAGPGRNTAWTDVVVFSPDAVFGNADDIVLGQVRHEEGLQAGESYSGAVSYSFGPAFSARGHVFVRTDKAAEVWENSSEANNTGEAAALLDVMPVAYADLQVESVTTQGTAYSGRSLNVSWSVANNGIGITNTATWSDNVWLSRNPDGSGVVAQFGASSHIGQLAAGDHYTRSIVVTLPEGISGSCYLNVSTGGPFEFVYGNNNSRASMAVPVELSLSPDLLVEAVSAPESAQEGALIDVTWSVINQGEAAAVGAWVDNILLVPASGTGNAVSLGNFTYDRSLEAGIRYTRTEQVRLPTKIEGLYRIKIVTNANLGSAGSQVYEHAAARNNNATTATGISQISLNPRPDLRVGNLVVPDNVTAGTNAAIQYTVSNQGPLATSGRWTDRVYLSLDNTLSADDKLLGSYDNGAALAPGESYANASASIGIPIRVRGDAYLLVWADANNSVDEYPNDGNNIQAAKIHVDPIPFADLVTSDIVAPEQGIHGGSIEVRYKVSNLGSNVTLGDSASVDSWTDSIWLSRDKTRPAGWKGDILLASFTHKGHLAVGQDYLGAAQVTLPDDLLTGQYYLTVWSDTYDAILEDTLASNINLDDPTQTDNNNYKARPIGILGITPPDLTVTELSALSDIDAGGSYTSNYTVQNRGDLYAGKWTDTVFITDNPDLNAATERWVVASFDQSRSLANGERYSVSQTLQLAPSVKGRYIVVKTDAQPYSYTGNGSVKEVSESNNALSAASVINARPADLRVTEVLTDVSSEADNDSGEETTVTWTVTNHGEAVWAGTYGWIDSIYISSDPTFIPQRATALGSVVHANVNGLAAGASYTASAKVRLPAGTDGQYYIYVITDSRHDSDSLTASPHYQAQGELTRGDNRNDQARDKTYATSVYEGARNDNNMGRGVLDITYREPDLQIDSIVVSDPNPGSGQRLTVTWTVTNTGTRETRTNAWYDGIYLSRDASLDSSDCPVVDQGSEAEIRNKVRLTNLTEDYQPKYLQPGESYTNSTTFSIPESISGDFYLIVKADTASVRDPYNSVSSTVRDGLPVIYGSGSGAVGEFKDEGNNVAAIALPISLTPPPDLQVAQVTAPEDVIAGQVFQVSYQVINNGGKTPSDQQSWYDLVYLSKDRFLDVSKDRYLGYVTHTGGLDANASYDVSLALTAPRDLEGAYYVFVVSDPANVWGKGAFGSVREFGQEQNNATAAVQPILIETPPPADLKVTNVVVPGQVAVGDDVTIQYSVVNDSINPAYGRWTDALYLSADNAWDLGDILLGKVEHVGGLGANSSYVASLQAKLPPLKDGGWRVIVRPDLYNEVYEGAITYTETGLNIAPGEANNRIASAATLQVTVPELAVAAPLQSSLSNGQSRLFKVSVAAGQTLRVNLDSSASTGANELYIRYANIPTGFAFDAAYSNPVAPDQEVLIPSTQAGDYYILVKSRQSAESSVTLRADLLPLSITRITPDQGGAGGDEQRWVTIDIHGAAFQPGALVKLARPGIYEIEPARWQVLDATHIQAVFDLRDAPLGLYDVSVINPDGQHVTEPYRYLVERAIEADVTLGLGGPRSLSPGDSATYSVSLQSLSNIDTPYVRFDFGVPEMGDSAYVLQGLNLPYVTFSNNLGGQPDGQIETANGNNQAYGPTPTTGTPRTDIPWASLDGTSNTNGLNLAPGYAMDVAAGGFVGMSFNVQTYPGLAEWMNYDFEGLRSKLYTVRPDWQAQGLLDGGVQDLNNIAPGLAAKFLSKEPNEHITKLENLAIPFRFNIVGAATPLTRDEFIAEQTAYAEQLRLAILADPEAPASLDVLASDASQWVQGWLGALETAGLLRPVDQAPPIRLDPKVISLNATLATGILLSRAGDTYQTQADILGFFAQVQAWYGDTAKWAGDPAAAVAPIEYLEYRADKEGNEVEIPVPALVDASTLNRNAAQETHFINFNVFAGSLTELEYLRRQGLLDPDFNPVGPQALNLTQYLQQAAQQLADSQSIASIRGPQGVLDAAGKAYVPADTPLPYSISFQNPSNRAVGQLRIVTQLDADLDPRALRLGDLKLGDINIHVPGDKANFQGDFDFSGSKGFILRVSAGIDADSRIATWLIQAIDPDTGEVLHDETRGLLAPVEGSAAGSAESGAQPVRGFVNYTLRSLDTAVSGAEIEAQARVIFDDAPPVDTASIVNVLDAAAPITTVTVTALSDDPLAAPSFDVRWNASDAASGVKHVTVYVAENGADFKIWLRQIAPDQTQAMFVGKPGASYEFLAVATDHAGNLEAARIANAVLPDDGSRQAVLDALGTNESLGQSQEVPLAATDRDYAANAMFEQAVQRLPGFVAPLATADLQTVLAPFALRPYAEGFGTSDADIGALALVELPDQGMLVSAGSLRNEVYRYDKEGGRSTTPLFSLDVPVLDMALDAHGQLWVMTGSELLLVDAESGSILRRVTGPRQEPLTHALAIQSGSGDIYVSSGNGIELFRPGETDPNKMWRHFSNERVGDLAFGPDGRLWGVRWTGSEITSATPDGSADIVSFALSGQNTGRAELEYRLDGVIDSIAFGVSGTALDGLLFASSTPRQRPLVDVVTQPVPHSAAVWMVELQTRRILQLANGGTRGESLVATQDGRLRIAQTYRIDEIAPLTAPNVLAISVPDGALLPLPVNSISVSFDQAMWTGLVDVNSGASAEERASDPSSVLNPANYLFTRLGADAGLSLLPNNVTWNAATRTAVLDMPNLPAGQYQLQVLGNLRSAAQIRLSQSVVSTFTGVIDMTHQLRLDFTATRADRATGEVSYDVSITNIGSDDLHGPLTLLLDPGRYFQNNVLGGVLGDVAGGKQSDLWLINLTESLATLGGKLAVGATLSAQTISVHPATQFGTTPGAAQLVKFNLDHGIYAVPLQNTPPSLGIAGEVDNNELSSNQLPDASAGQPWSADLEATDADGTLFYWQLVQAPTGVSLTPSGNISSGDAGYASLATLTWTPSARDRADSEIVVRVQDSRGGVATQRFSLNVVGGNSAPVINPPGDITLAEGETLHLPIIASDADGDPLTVTLAKLPAGARFDAASGVLSWAPDYDQAGNYNDIVIIASDGKSTVQERFNLYVEQAYAQPVLAPVAPQTLREGDRFALQLAGYMPGGLFGGLSNKLTQADGTQISLSYYATLLPAGATLNTETGWLQWTPGYAQHGSYRVPVTLAATYIPADGVTSDLAAAFGQPSRMASSSISDPVITRVTRNIDIEVLNANGAPQFAAAETWNVLEGQPLRIGVFAFDPDNPDFEPRIRLTPQGPASGPETTAASVSYSVSGLPEGASFDAETLEIVWTPGYQQSGSYTSRLSPATTATPPARPRRAPSRCPSWSAMPTAHRRSATSPTPSSTRAQCSKSRSAPAMPTATRWKSPCTACRASPATPRPLLPPAPLRECCDSSRARATGATTSSASA